MIDLTHIFSSPPPAPSIEPDLKVGFLLTPRFSLLPFAGFIDCLRHAADESDHSRQVFYHWHVVAPAIAPITASCGVPVMPELTLSEVEYVDLLVVVGGHLPWAMEVPDETLVYLRKVHKSGTTIIGLCTGSFVLARAGLLDGKRCAIHLEHQSQMKTLFPDTFPITDQNFVVEDRIITCNGGTSAIDLAATLIKTHSGEARAVKALNSLMVDPRRAVHHMPQRFYGHLISCGNWRVEQGTALMEQNLSNHLTVSALAIRLNTSKRELTRAFRKHTQFAPAEIYRNMRLAHGNWLLTNSSRTITQIAFECGFSDGAHFSRWFKQTYKETPNQFRMQRSRIETTQSLRRRSG